MGELDGFWTFRAFLLAILQVLDILYPRLVMINELLGSFILLGAKMTDFYLLISSGEPFNSRSRSTIGSIIFRRYTVAPWGYYGHLIYFQTVPSLRGTVSAGPELRGIVLVVA